MVRLRRSSPDRPGWTRRRAGKGFVYLDGDGTALVARRRPAGQGPGDPARVAGRLDLPVAERPPAGGRYRRRRPAAVPLPPRLAHPAGRREVPEDGHVREGAVEGPRAGAGRPRRRGDDEGACVRGRRTAARPRVLPDRQRRLRGGEQQLRADHARAAARPARGQDDGLRLRGQVRDRAPDHHRRPGRRRGAGRDAEASRRRRPAVGVEGRPDLAAGGLVARQRVRRPDDGHGGHGQGLPHLARDRHRGGLAGVGGRAGRRRPRASGPSSRR